MLGVFGDTSKIKTIGYMPDIIYVGLNRINGFIEGVVPFLWVPKATDVSEGVVDIHDRRYLFAFNNSGCIANPGIIKRTIKALEKAYDLGYRKVLLDAARLPSPIDGLFFLTTCFCRYSIELYHGLNLLRSKVRGILHRADTRSVTELLEELAYARAEHVEYLLSILNDKARELGMELIAAVFPYPLSKYVGQEPKVLKNYLREVHVMLYHRCPGAACLNAEVKHFVRILHILGLKHIEINEILQYITGLELDANEIKELDKGIDIKHVEKLMDINREVYGDIFVPIIWLDEVTQYRLNNYLETYHKLDIFAT